ncbi:hypothetical protein HK097_007047 [Rhizophlyctis rosea]|uniref:Uncharacterized protein n=1 Tax=Rhizophlyctis rosea TaxID=64517 RepID=A0AAD5SDM8_9FUNG|nr:hypothetical protein HK097_007047 [Rhizophlyctis rosea]
MIAPIARRAVQSTAVKTTAPALAIWGAFAGTAALFFLEPTPIARNDVFKNLPLIGGWWQKKLDAAAQKD